MKNNIASIIMLAAGAIAVICCVIWNYNLNRTLWTVFIVLLIFAVIGFISQAVIQRINKEAEERAKQEDERKSQEERDKQQAEFEQEIKDLQNDSEEKEGLSEKNERDKKL